MTFQTSARGYVRLNQAEMNRFLRAANGPVVRDLVIRATRVQLAAQQQVRLGHVHAGGTNFGKGVGNLRSSIRKRIIPAAGGGSPSVVVGSDDPIAMIYHQGAKPHVIKPRRARVLVFWTGSGRVITNRVNHPGTPPNRYLTDNLKYAII